MGDQDPAALVTHARAHHRIFSTPADTAPLYGRVVVRPQPLAGPLRNPGTGVQTFQRFRGQALNPGTGWSESGPLARLPEAQPPPDFPDSSIAYCRWFWRDVEPQRGQFLWGIVDLALEEARRHDQTLAVRLMPYGPEEPVPDWYRQSGARRAPVLPGDDGAVWHPDFSDPQYLAAWGAVVAGFGARYDGHPTLETVDISSIGFWGEGWSPHMPEFAHQRALLDLWLDALPGTLLLCNIDQVQALRHATTRGAGWRLDCLGDMGARDAYTWCHMLEKYPQQIARAGISEVWRRRPVSLEVCWVMATWHQRGWDIEEILAQALGWHASSINLKSSAIPPDWRAAFDEFTTRLGYRLLLRQACYQGQVRRGHMSAIELLWHNAGVAPPYRPYRLALRLCGRGACTILELPDTADAWLPGDALVERRFYVAPELPEGEYALQLALLCPYRRTPAIRLAIGGRHDDGWYTLGPLQVTA
jgi:hypothetical protein